MRKFTVSFCVALMAAMGACKDSKNINTNPDKSLQNISYNQFANVDGLNIRYKIDGKTDGPVLLLLHGFTSSLESWDGLAAELADEYKIVRFDLPGHGLTGADPQNQYSHTDFVSAVHGFIGELGLTKPTLMGNSMGGNIAWRYAATYPDDINKLILIDASGFPLNGLSDTPLQLPPILEGYFLKPTKFAVNYGLKNQYVDADKIPAGRADKILEMMTKPGNGHAFVEIYKVFTLPDPTSELAKITAPTLVIWGEKDGIVPPEHAKLFDAALPISQVTIIENTGHVPHEENPQQTAQEIRRFLNQ